MVMRIRVKIFGLNVNVAILMFCINVVTCLLLKIFKHINDYVTIDMKLL